MFTAVALICQLATDECQVAKSVQFYGTESQCLDQLLELKIAMLKTGKLEVKDAVCIGWMVDDETF